LADAVADLERHGQLVRIDHEVDPELEAAEIHRRVYAAGGLALLFTRVKGSAFSLASNLFGTLDRARFLFRDALPGVRQVLSLKADLSAPLRRPFSYLGAARTALHMLPKRVGSGPLLASKPSVTALPQVKHWPLDGG